MRSIKAQKSLMQKAVIFGILIIIFVSLSLLSPEFLTMTNMNNVARQVTLVIITGCGVSLLMIAQSLDLSVGSVVAISGVLLAKLVSGGWSFSPALVIVIIFGAAIGMLNALEVVFLKITPVIATMGTMYIARGAALIICDGKAISTGLPKSFSQLGTGYLFDTIPTQLLIMLILVTIFTFIETRTVLGKYAFAIGGNKTAAKLSGINTKLIETTLFVITGALAAFSGVILASRLGVGQPNVGEGFEFDVIVAVVLGGTSLAGGEGSVIGMVIGAFIVGFLGNGLNLLGVQSFYQSVFKGVVLVGAVILDSLLKKRIR